MQRSRFFIAAVVTALLLVGAGCSSSGVATNDNAADATVADNAPAPQPHETADGVWRPVASGIDRAVFSADSASDATMEIYRFSGSDLVARMEADKTPMTVGAWADKLGGEVFVVNGTYFHDDHLPSGFLTKDGVQAGNRKFDLDKSGLLQFSPTFRIINTKNEHVDLTPENFPNAAQSYPFLIVDGQQAVAQDSGQKSRRTFVGQDVDGTMYVGVVDDGLVSLFGLTDALVATEVQWQNVLNLDGGSSTGLVSTFGDGESRDSFAEVPNVLVVQRAVAGAPQPSSDLNAPPADDVNQ